jgi:hypothetical protein
VDLTMARSWALSMGASWASLLITLSYSVFMPTYKSLNFNELNNM